MNFMKVTDGHSREFHGVGELQQYLEEHLLPEVSCEIPIARFTRLLTRCGNSSRAQITQDYFRAFNGPA